MQPARRFQSGNGTRHEVVGLRGHAVVAGHVVCLHGHVVDLTTLQTAQETAATSGVTGISQPPVSRGLDGVVPGTARRCPGHPRSAHVVGDGEKRGGARLWREETVESELQNGSSLDRKGWRRLKEGDQGQSYCKWWPVGALATTRQGGYFARRPYTSTQQHLKLYLC